ncbi:MAG: hypothetical protein KAV99_03110 [Candidatus Latescibacteria bacterium]|nr:hypothetical protein [Candidatus Latescibacterota bacterium]
MSIKIGLRSRTKIDLDILSQGASVRLIRLLATIQLKTATGWTKKYQAIIDTGNPISVIPFSIWSQAEVSPLLPCTLAPLVTGNVSFPSGFSTFTFYLLPCSPALSPPLHRPGLR